MVSLRTLIIACMVTALVATGGGMLGASLLASASGPAGAQGPAGADGLDGVDGAAGSDGAPGLQGVAGAPGAAGPRGPAGERGPAGAMGPQGSAGAEGAAGADGSEGLQGPPGVQGEIGPAGPSGIIDLAVFSIGTLAVGPSTSRELPLTQTGGDLAVTLLDDGDGGGILNLPAGLYRFSTTMFYSTASAASAGTFRIRAEDVAINPLLDPLVPGNAASVQLNPAQFGSGFFASTSTTLRLDELAKVWLALGVAGDTMTALEGWLLVEKLD